MAHTRQAMTPRLRAMLLTPCLLAVLASCAGSPADPVDFTAPRALDAPKPYSNRDRPVTTMISSAQSRANAAAAKGRLVDRVTFAAPLSTIDRARGGESPATGAERRVKLAFNDAQAKDVIRIITSEYLGRGFIIDPSINDKITMDIDQQMSVADVADLLAALARIYDWVIEDTSGVLYVTKLTGEAGKLASVPILTDRVEGAQERAVIRVRRFRYIDPSAAKPILTPFMNTNSVVEPQGRLLIMIDTQSQIFRAEQMLDMLDVPPFTDVEMLRYRLANIPVESGVTLLTELANQTGLSSGPASDPVLSFVRFPGSQDLFVLLRDATLAPAVADLIAQVDAPRAQGTRLRYIYNVQHYDTTRLQGLVQDFYSGMLEGTAQPASQNVRLPEATDRMRLSWDLEGGKLLVYATPEDYADLLSTLRVLDRAPQQVSISAVIAEVGLTNNLEYGVEYFLEGLDVDGFGTLDFTGSTGGTEGVPTGSAFFAGASGFAIVQALDNEGDVEILSQPHVTVVDGGTAKIQIGGEVPISEGNVDTETGGLRQQITYRDTGTTLDIQVNVNESGEVAMKVLKEISAVGPDSDLGPTFTTRELNTDVIVPHGKTLVLGGIVDTANRGSTTKIPLIGEIPVLGLAFQSQSQRDSKTEILLTITPRIINDPSEADAITSDFIASSRAIQDMLYRVADELPTGMLRPAGTFPNSDVSTPDASGPIGTVEPFSVGSNSSSERAGEVAEQPNAAPVQANPPQMPAFMEELLKSVERQNERSQSEK